MTLAKNYLPDKTLTAQELPPISFVVFGNDTRGYDNIVLDILYAIEQGDNLKFLVGHEAHHFYRNKCLEFHFPEYSDPEYNIIRVLNQIQAEGIADQSDKRARYFEGGDLENSKWADKYKNYLQNTPVLLKKMDSLFVRLFDHQDESKSIGTALKQIVPMSGHLTGYFMTNAIIEKSGKTALLNNFGNPFGFFRLYNKAAAAANDRYPEFSEKTLNLINLLELKYAKSDKL